MIVVADASAVAAALVEAGPVGEWAREALRGAELAAPTHVHVEVSSMLRRSVLAGRLGHEAAGMAHQDLVDLSFVLVPFGQLAPRVWELHPSVTPYDAAHVALAENLGAPLVTADRRLARAPGPSCTFRTPG